MTRKLVEDDGHHRERPVSLAPLDLQAALGGLLQVKPPEKPERSKRKKVPPNPVKG
jgi:hypothetical protein